MDVMDVEEYLGFVIDKIQKARAKNDLVEVKRMLEVCAAVLIDIAKEKKQ